MGFGPIALRVAGSAEVRFRDVAAKDLNRKVELATVALAEMGLSISDAIRLLMLRVVDERRLPFEVRAPGAATRRAITELERRKGKGFTSTAALMADLNADD
jgi:DNA-damage-inducible protein J